MTDLAASVDELLEELDSNDFDNLDSIDIEILENLLDKLSYYIVDRRCNGNIARGDYSDFLTDNDEE